MFEMSCGLPWLVSVPSLSRMICGCCAEAVGRWWQCVSSIGRRTMPAGAARRQAAARRGGWAAGRPPAQFRPAYNAKGHPRHCGVLRGP